MDNNLINIIIHIQVTVWLTIINAITHWLSNYYMKISWPRLWMATQKSRRSLYSCFIFYISSKYISWRCSSLSNSCFCGDWCSILSMSEFLLLSNYCNLLFSALGFEARGLGMLFLANSRAFSRADGSFLFFLVALVPMLEGAPVGIPPPFPFLTPKNETELSTKLFESI